MAKSHHKDDLCDVKEVTGDYPAILGLDFFNADNPDELRVLNVLAKYAFDRGMVITICAHMKNPITGGPFYINRDHGDVIHTLRHMLPGGSGNAKFRQFLDTIADFAHNLVDSKGNHIPVLFRPFHEMNGSWFFWGMRNKANNTAEDYKKVFRYTVQYLRDVKGVHNLLYVFVGNAGYSNLHTPGQVATGYLECYPGDDVVDLMGVDDYTNVITPSKRQFFVDKMAELVHEAERRGKIPALSEVGFQENGIDKQPDFWMENVLNPIKGKTVSRPQAAASRIAYMFAWNNWCLSHDHCVLWVPYKGHPGEQYFRNFYSDPVTLFNRDYQSMYD